MLANAPRALIKINGLPRQIRLRLLRIFDDDSIGLSMMPAVLASAEKRLAE